MRLITNDGRRFDILSSYGTHIRTGGGHLTRAQADNTSGDDAGDEWNKRTRGGWQIYVC